MRTSLDVLAPQRTTATAHASGARCGHFSLLSHTHGVARHRSPRSCLRWGSWVRALDARRSQRVSR
jgi:hypothetical protein